MSLWISNILIFTMGNFIFSQHFHFLVQKFNIFSTFGSNQDDHEIVLDKYFVRTKYFSYQPEIILLNSNINATTTSLDPNLSGPKIWQKFVLIRNLWAIISNDSSVLSQIFLVQISLNSKYLWTQNIFGAKSFWTKIFLNQTFLGPTRFLTCHNFTRIFLNPILLGKNFRSGLKFLLLTKCL